MLCLSVQVQGQNVFGSEDELKKQANELFEEGEFIKAYPLFSQLLSLYPKDPQYNYKFGTCLLYAGSDKEKAIAYIEYAAKRQKSGVDPEVFFYLGKAYHLNYRFADALRVYGLYKSMASSKKLEKYDVQRQMEMCENGLKLLKTVTDLSVLDKKEVPDKDFFRSYNLTEFNAKLILRPDDLKTSLDKKKKEDNVMYLAPNRDQILFSSYGEDGKNGRDIYMVTRSSSGDLSKPVRLSDVINTKYDEDFPFLHPSGKTLYFCSKGHNSMGGYDVFKSQWNESTQSWGKPVNLDFAINTPDDDILFITDEEEKTAYFSSRRESASGQIAVYKIKLERRPLDLAIVKGVLTKEVGDKMPRATITVTKAMKDEVIGVFHSNAADGSYTLSLPNGGKFLLTVESPEFKKSSELVVIPTQKEIKPLKQTISLVNEGGQDKLIVKNEFDSQIDSTDLALAVQYIKAKASLEITPEEKEVTAVAVEEPGNAAAQDTKSETKENAAPVSNNDIIEMAYTDAKETQKEANELRKNSDAAQSAASQRNELSLKKNKEATELFEKAESTTNQDEKLRYQEQGAMSRKEAQQLSSDAALYLTLANQMDEQAKAKQQQADAELKYAKDLDNAIKESAGEKRMNDLLAQKEELDKKREALKTTASISSELNRQAEDKQNEASRAMSKYMDMQQDVEDLTNEANRLRTEAEKTKNEAVKQNLIQQAEETEKEAGEKKSAAQSHHVTASRLQAEADSLKASAQQSSAMIKEIQSGAPITVSTSTTPAPITSHTISTSSASTSTTQPAAATTPSVTTTTTAANTQSEPANTASSEPLVIKSDYVDNFIGMTKLADGNPDELKKQEALAKIYQAWTDSLDNQIARLREQLATTQVGTHKEQIQYKINELTSSVEEKRQKAADSRSQVDNIKMKEALAAAETTSPVTTNPATTPTTTATQPAANTTTTQPAATTTASAETAPEDLNDAEKINDHFTGKLNENEKESNEYIRKSREQELYTDWAATLYNESQRLRAEGKDGRAQRVQEQSMEKQTLAMQAGDKVTEISNTRPELVDAAKTATLTTTAPAVTEPAATTPTTTAATEPATITNPPATATATSTTTPSTTTASGEPPAATAPASSTPVASSGQLSSVPPENIKAKDEYVHYVALKNEADWSRKTADRQKQQAEDLKKLSEEQARESEKINQRAATTQDPNVQKVLQQQSEELDKKSMRNQFKADSVASLARNSEAESNAKQTESELYLQSLDKASYEEVTAATGYKPATVSAPASTTTPTSANTTSSTEPTTLSSTTTTTSEPVAPATSSTPTVTATTPATTSTTTPRESTTVVATIPSKTETAPVKTETETETIAQPATVITPASEYKSEPATTSTSGTRPASTSTTAPVTTTAPATTTASNPVTTTANETTPVNTNVPSTSSTTSAPVSTSAAPSANADLLKYYDQLFDRLEMQGSDYSAARPIPVDPPMPEGLVFKVQIGAFRNAIPQNLFKGIKPISAETTPQGLKRYTAGLFTKFSAASQAKTQVNNLGYRDAFVVAFYNGKRISMNEAMVKARESGETIDAAAAAAAAPASSATSANISASVPAATATDVKSVSGLFYAVQIGVFSRPTSSVQLYNINPLNSERTESGLIRYTTGRFSSEAAAIQAKNSIAAKGIKDAFVVAYMDGKRVSLSAAKSTLDAQGSSVITKDKQEFSFIPSDTTTTETSASNLNTAASKGITFRVQVGAYREKVPISEANRLLKLSSRGIKTFRDDAGLIIYTVGDFLEYESANALKNIVIGEGIQGAFVIGMQNGRKITAAEALELIKNR